MCMWFQVTTKDGYILNMQRIPEGRVAIANGEKKQPVLLQHGLMTVSLHTLFWFGVVELVSQRGFSFGFLCVSGWNDMACKSTTTKSAIDFS